MFLSPNAIYMLTFNLSTEDFFEPIEYWLNSIIVRLLVIVFILEQSKYTDLHDCRYSYR